MCGTPNIELMTPSTIWVALKCGKVRGLIALLTKPSERFISGSEGHFPGNETTKMGEICETLLCQLPPYLLTYWYIYITIYI